MFAERTRDEWNAFADQHDCCLEPVLDLGEALDSELVREREMVVEVDQPGAQAPVRLLGHPVKFSGTPADAEPARPGAGRAHRGGAGRPGLLARAGGRAGVRGRGRRSAGGGDGLVPGMNRDGLLKMSELADASGVSAGTIKHYLREGLLGEGEDVVRTSRNMAYYPPELRRADPADQAAPGGALHAAAGHPARAGGRPRARPGAGGARGPDPGPRAGRRREPRVGRPAQQRATTSRARRWTGWSRSAC